MIVDIYAEKKKRGRKKKIVETTEEMQQNNDIYCNSILTKREKMRMEKYGIIGYEPIVDIFNNISQSKNLPNLTIYGECGSGKSYLVNWLLSKLFKNYFRERVLYMSLNEERGISTMREKIKAFSNIQVKENHDIPSFKVIVFDQAEYISLDAQNALRRIIEVSNNISRFIFITRNTRSIIDPILSRCLQLNLNTDSQLIRVSKYYDFFPNISKEKIDKICRIYRNFGREISMLETMSILDKNDIERFEIEEKIIGDEECDILMNLYENEVTLNNLVQFISNYMRNVNVIFSIEKIYEKLRIKYGNNKKFQKISELFLQFEISNNFEASENIFLLNLLRNCSPLT